jgi:uncharacterized protein YbjT (DUF2867 family)
VVALVRPRGERAGALDGVEVVAGDMADAAALALLLRGCDAYIHVASLGFGHAGVVTKAVDDSRVPRAVFFSSTSIYTKLPAASKAPRLDAEEKVRSLASAWTILRPTMIYGAVGDRNLERLIRFMARSPVVPLPGGGKGLVQPVHVEDLGRAAVDTLLCDKTHGRAYDLAGGEASPLRDLVQHVHALLGRGHLVLPLPIAPMAFAAGVWSVLRLPPRVKPEQIQRLAEDKAFSFEAARADWGYAPRSWREGLTAEVAALRASGFIP